MVSAPRPTRPSDDRSDAAAPADRSPQEAGSPGAPGGDVDAFLRRLYAEYATRVHAHVAKMLSDPHQAEDVVQETMLRAWRKFDTLSPERGSVSGWIFRVAHNIAIDKLRVRRSRPVELEDTYGNLVAYSITDHAEETVNSVYLSRALAALPAPHRAVLREVYFADRTCAEAAAVLGIPVGTVKSRLYYALRKLRDGIDEQPPQAEPVDQDAPPVGQLTATTTSPRASQARPRLASQRRAVAHREIVGSSPSPVHLRQAETDLNKPARRLAPRSGTGPDRIPTPMAPRPTDRPAGGRGAWPAGPVGPELPAETWGELLRVRP